MFTYLCFVACGQPDDDHKQVADLWTKYSVVFWLDLFCLLDYLRTQQELII